MTHPIGTNLWAITCYFNPVGYRRRLENYRTFRQNLKVPLVTVELSSDKKFQLTPTDAEVLVQLHSPAVLWQKERLLNVALSSVPKNCDKVAWLDCDLLFENDDWRERASRALDEFALVHLFQERHELPMDFRPGISSLEPDTIRSNSIIYQLGAGKTTAEDAARPGGLLRGSTAGLAWASRRDILDEYGLYDAFIVGGGDRAIALAALGMFDHVARAREMNRRRIQHYQQWAWPYSRRVEGCVSYIHGRVFHLWHGDLGHRKHQERHHEFARFDFDPFVDIAVDRNGCWKWNSDKAELHAFVRNYVESRNEDGE
jgi:hypothetical protein